MRVIKTIFLTIMIGSMMVIPAFAADKNEEKSDDLVNLTFVFDSKNTGITNDITIIYRDANDLGIVARLKQTEGYKTTVSAKKGKYELCLNQTASGDSILSPKTLDVKEDMEIPVYANLGNDNFSTEDGTLPEGYAVAGTEFAYIMQQSKINNDKYNIEQAILEQHPELQGDLEPVTPNDGENNESKAIPVIAMVLSALLIIITVVALIMKAKERK